MKWEEKEFNRFAGYRSCESFPARHWSYDSISWHERMHQTFRLAVFLQQIYLHSHVVGWLDILITLIRYSPRIIQL